jgi:hypothetical protein
VIDGDRELELVAPEPHHVVVLGYAGEPLLRFSSAGVDVNERSPTAITVKLARRGAVPALDPHALPSWRQVANGRRFRWHDDRLRPVPGRQYGEGDVAAWSIPIVVDGARDRIAGRLWHARGPPFWIWLCAVALTLGLGTLVSRRADDRLARFLAVAGAAVSATAAVLLGVALGLGAQTSSSWSWSSAFLSALAAVSALLMYVSMRRSPYAVLAPGVAAFFTTMVALSSAGVLVHGYVISTLPAGVARSAAATAICAGVLAVTTTVIFVFRVDTERERAAQAPRPSRRAMTVPRGRRR